MVNAGLLTASVKSYLAFEPGSYALYVSTARPSSRNCYLSNERKQWKWPMQWPCQMKGGNQHKLIEHCHDTTRKQQSARWIGTNVFCISILVRELCAPEPDKNMHEHCSILHGCIEIIWEVVIDAVIPQRQQVCNDPTLPEVSLGLGLGPHPSTILWWEGSQHVASTALRAGRLGMTSTLSIADGVLPGDDRKQGFTRTANAETLLAGDKALNPLLCWMWLQCSCLCVCY